MKKKKQVKSILRFSFKSQKRNPYGQEIADFDSSVFFLACLFFTFKLHLYQLPQLSTVK